MTIEVPQVEVCSPEIGLVRISHVRAVAGATFHELSSVIVSVVATSRPVRVAVTLMKKPSGRGQHLLFSCPTCSAPRAILFADGGGVACRPCTNARTRQQLEASRTSWRAHAVDTEDRLLRLLGRRCLDSSAIAYAQQLADEVIEGDGARYMAVASEVRALALLDDERTRVSPR